jgi:mycothiol synthase
VSSFEYLDSAQQAAVLGLVLDATSQDGVPPLSEHVALHLRDGGDEKDIHFLIHDGDQLAGYAHLDMSDLVEGPSAELVVHPNLRGRGIGSTLMREVIGAAGPTLRLWSHGDLPDAERLAQALGFERVRTLLQMRRSLLQPLPGVSLPDSISLRHFQPEKDEQPWLEVNGRAFQGHPEQGNWSIEDLQRRMIEPWFDPEGFLIGEESTSGRVAAFCWTKIHGGIHRDQPHDGGSRPHAHGAGHGHDPIGEIYVIGVDPDFHGQGLGKALTLAGLRHLLRTGLTTAMLYVDADNHSAISMYSKLGFTEWGRDVMYRARGA